MIVRFSKYSACCLTVLALFVLPSVGAAKGIGFQADFSTPPSWVSGYIDKYYDLSVAMYPKTYPLLSRDVERVSQVVGEDAENETLRFNTAYRKKRGEDKYLVPVSVGARDYNAVRRRNYESDALQTLSTQQIIASGQNKRRQGLGINLKLPKRLDNIFGEGGAGLRVTGFRRITFSGRSQWTDAADNDTFKQNKFPSLNMEQISKFDITGTIGSKISVKVSQDNQTDIPLANRIQIRYRGDDDDILKTIEAGNTTLRLPNTQFVGYSSQIRGLFGIKAEAQLGGLTLTGIASQEKGSTEKSSFSATGEEQSKWMRDYDYAEGRIFDLGLARDSLQPADSIAELYIYELVDRTDDLNYKVANLWVDPNVPDSFSAESAELINMRQIDEQQYTFYSDASTNQHYVVFSSTRQRSKDLGYYMRIVRNGQDIIFGDITSDTLQLKLLYRNSSRSNPNQETWKMMWRNIYPIPLAENVEDLNIRVVKGLPGTEGSNSNLDYQSVSGTNNGKYIEILGLDQYTNGTSTKKPDGKVDDRDAIFRPDWRLLVFPNRRPFDSDTTFVAADSSASPELDVKVASIYDYTSPTNKTENSQYYILVSSEARSNIIRLNKANIIEGSDVVRLNGSPLKRGTDYTIQYDFGQITLLTPEANDPNADITVDFEYAPFFAVQKKTLLGARAKYEWSENFSFGSTILYKSDKAEERKPRVGQETAKMTVLDFDAALKVEPSFLTKAIDALPLIETDAPSVFNISGEVAQSRPNPNVDNVAFVDDFEAAIEDLSLSTSRTSWQKSSFPLQLDSLTYDRGRMLWHTPREQVLLEDVYDREAAQGEGSIRTMRLVFRPNVKDTLGGVIADDPRPTWSGIMRYFASIDAKRAQLFELRARASDSFKGRLHMDVGQISEDINGDGIEYSEDLVPKDDAVVEAEDIGLDGLEDQFEPNYDSVTNRDPNGDNWYFLGEGDCPFPDNECAKFKSEQRWNNNDSLYFEWLNGTEGNRVDVSVFGYPDEEPLSSGGFNRNDAYFSYVIDFSDPASKFYKDSLKVEGTEKSSGADRPPWVTYRIPIRDSNYVDTSVVSDPSLTPDWSSINHVRIWWESAPGQTTPDTIEVAAWYFVQSNWQDSVLYDPRNPSNEQGTNFVVAAISEDENAAFGTTPAEPYKDPTTNVTEPRGGLLLKYENLHHGDTCLATKDLLSVDRYSGYKSLEMYVHSDVAAEDIGKLKMFFRLGRDAENFYEQQVTVYPDWDERNYINIKFDEITDIKDNGLKALEDGEILDITQGAYRVRGSPNINEIRYFAVGVVNADTSQTPDLMNGEIWLDELRVTDVRRDVGTAGRLSIAGNLADLVRLSFTFQSKDPYFRGISAATRGGSTDNLGSGSTQTTYGFNATITGEKLLPRSWGARVPISVSYSKSVLTPLLRTNSDIVLPEEKRIEEQTVSESRSFSVSESFKKQGKNPLFTLLLNRMTNTLSYRRNSTRTPNVPYSFGENVSVTSRYDLTIQKPPSIPIFYFIKPIPLLNKVHQTPLSLWPGSWRANATYSRNLTITDDASGSRRSSLTRSFDGSMDVTYKMFPNLTATYRYQTRRDLSDLDLVNIAFKNFKLGLETNFSESFTASYGPRLFKFLTHSLSYKATYRDDYNRSNESKVATRSDGWGVNGSFDHMKLLGGSGGSRRTRGSRFGGGTRRAGRPGTGQAKKEEDGKPFYDPALSVMRFLTGWIRPINYRYDESYSASLPGLTRRPGLKYRFGLTREANVPTIQDTRSPSASEGEGYEFSSGFVMFGGLSTDIKFRRDIKRDILRQGKRTESRSTSWPDLSIRIQKFKSLPLIKGMVNKFIDVFGPRTGFNRQTKESINIDDALTVSESESMNFSPLLSINFNVIRALSLNGTYNVTRTNDKNYNPIDGSLDTESKSTNKTITVSGRYSFSAPGGLSIPLFGKLKFKSTMNIELNIKRSSSKSEVSNDGGPFASSTDKSDISIIPIITYVFSQQIKGGLSGRWQDNNDNKRDQKSHIRELRIWAEIRF